MAAWKAVQDNGRLHKRRTLSYVSAFCVDIRNRGRLCANGTVPKKSSGTPPCDFPLHLGDSSARDVTVPVRYLTLTTELSPIFDTIIIHYSYLLKLTG